MQNLDYLCMKYGQRILEDYRSKTNNKGNDNNQKILENNLRKSLGILDEDGVYAMFLWMEKNAQDIRKELINFLNGSEQNDIKICNYLLNGSTFEEDFSKFCKNLQEVAHNLDKLLFMKKILERTLTYALYHAKIGE